MDFEGFATLLVIVTGDGNLLLLGFQFQFRAFDAGGLSEDGFDFFWGEVAPSGGLGRFVAGIYRFDVAYLDFGFAGAKRNGGRAYCDADHAREVELSFEKGHSRGC